MRAGGVTFLLGLALIQVSWAVTIPGNSTNDAEEKPTALADGVKFYHKIGYVFDGDEIFTEKANSILKYSAEAMKGCTTDGCSYYTYYKKIGSHIMILDVTRFKLGDLTEPDRKPEVVKSGAVWKNGYIFDNDETFTEKANSLLQHSFPVMKQCTTREGRIYDYCIIVGDDIFCLYIQFQKNAAGRSHHGGLSQEKKTGEVSHTSQKMSPVITRAPVNPSDPLNEELLNEDKDPLHFNKGYIFDDDEIFAEKIDSLLIYSARVMRRCTTKACRSYIVCNRMDDEMICLSVWLSKGANEVIDDMNYLNSYDEPNDFQEIDNEGFIYRELDDNNELLEGKERNDKFKTKVEEEKQK